MTPHTDPTSYLPHNTDAATENNMREMDEYYAILNMDPIKVISPTNFAKDGEESGVTDLPPEVLAQLTAMPEEKPDDFVCAICAGDASNRWNHSPRDYERPPICKSCETITGYSWNGRPMTRTKPKGGTHRDRRDAIRIAALADAISAEAKRKLWSEKHGCA